MQWTADIFLALRYLRPKRTFISVITLLSVIGPILGVALLVIVSAVMAGFDHDIRERILGMQAHLQVLPIISYRTEEAAVIEYPQPIMDKLSEIGASAAPIIEGPVLLQVRKNVSTKYLRGILPEREEEVTDLKNQMRIGRYDITEGEALIGEQMALEMGLGLGDSFLVHSPHRLTENIEWDEDGRIRVKEVEEVYLPEELKIVGIFAMGLHEYDTSMIFIHIDQAANVFGFDWGSATSVHASVPNPFNMEILADQARSAFTSYRILTWKEANQQLFGALRVEKNLMFFLLNFIIIVAAFGIAGTLITVAVQKTREIGILKAVGMSSGMVARVFVIQGAVIGLIGTAAGTFLGLLAIRYRNGIAELLGRIMGVEVFPKELYHLTQIPALVARDDVITIVLLAFLICVLASLIPALYASFLSPARALQEEN